MKKRKKPKPDEVVVIDIDGIHNASTDEPMKIEPTACGLFEQCSGPLCPLDSDIQLRTWWADEPICRSHTHGKHRWIRKQRSIQRRKTKSWLNRSVSFQELYDASRPMALTDEQRDTCRERLKRYHETKRNPMTVDSGSFQVSAIG
jgi:hypothetical protein